MYMFDQEISLISGSASSMPNNLSACFNESNKTISACIVHKNQVNVCNWNLESFASDTIPIKDFEGGNSTTILQAKYCSPSNRTSSLLAIATAKAAIIFDLKTNKILAWKNVDQISDANQTFARGICCSDTNILFGTHTGEILLFCCTSETNVNFRRSLQEHKGAIVDIATCSGSDIICSSDVLGIIIIWTKNLKGVQKTISTRKDINCINVMPKLVLIGTMSGQLLIYSTSNGYLMTEINAHCRQINAIAVALGTFMVATVAEDCIIRIWKLYTSDKEPLAIEWKHNEVMENLQLVGAQFTDNSGSSLIISAYDAPRLFILKLSKKLV